MFPWIFQLWHIIYNATETALDQTSVSKILPSRMWKYEIPGTNSNLRDTFFFGNASNTFWRKNKTRLMSHSWRFHWWTSEEQDSICGFRVCIVNFVLIFSKIFSMKNPILETPSIIKSMTNPWHTELHPKKKTSLEYNKDLKKHQTEASNKTI